MGMGMGQLLTRCNSVFICHHQPPTEFVMDKSVSFRQGANIIFTIVRNFIKPSLFLKHKSKFFLVQQ